MDLRSKQLEDRILELRRRKECGEPLFRDGERFAIDEPLNLKKKKRRRRVHNLFKKGQPGPC